MGTTQRVSRGFHRLLIGVALLVVLATATAHAAEFSGSVDKIVDGDTLWVCDESACHKIRICGIDAPEKGEPGYHESAEALRKLVEGKAVRCVQVGSGTPCDGRSKPTNHDRIVAQCFVDGADIAVPFASLIKSALIASPSVGFVGPCRASFVSGRAFLRASDNPSNH